MRGMCYESQHEHSMEIVLSWDKCDCATRQTIIRGGNHRRTWTPSYKLYHRFPQPHVPLNLLISSVKNIQMNTFPSTTRTEHWVRSATRSAIIDFSPPPQLARLPPPAHSRHSNRLHSLGLPSLLVPTSTLSFTKFFFSYRKTDYVNFSQKPR